MKRDHEAIAERLGPDALDSEVSVARQPGGGWDDGGEVRLSALHHFHTRTTSGGRGETTYFPHLYARGTCTELPVGHSGSHGPCPHEILVCVQSADREDVWELLCELAGFTPPTDEDRRRECERVKREILQRLAADGDPPPQRGSYFNTDHLFSWHLEDDVPLLLYALTDHHPDCSWYLDLKGARVVMGSEDAGLDQRQRPHEKGRYEAIPLLEQEELDLLGREDIEEIADAFVRSRGLEPAGRQGSAGEG